MSSGGKRKREEGTQCTQAGSLVGSAAPATKKVLNQGHAGTCVAYAFTLALQQGLDTKYDIAVNPEALVEKIKFACPCWEGHETERMPAEWNEIHADSGAFIEDVEKRYRYHVKVDFSTINSFEEARREMQRAEKLKMYTPCTVKTGAKGHERYAVTLTGTAPKGKMEAQNSWGGTTRTGQSTERTSFWPSRLTLSLRRIIGFV